MCKKAVVILADGFEEIEAVTVIDVLRRAGVNVTAVGLQEGLIKASRGVAVQADRIFDDADSDFDACILPGGGRGAENLAASEKVLSYLKKMHREKKIIAAICASPAVVLGKTGILDGKKATCYPGMQEKFGRTTTYREEPVVVDGNIITSRGPATAFSFAFALVEKLCGPDTREDVQKATLVQSTAEG